MPALVSFGYMSCFMFVCTDLLLVSGGGGGGAPLVPFSGIRKWVEAVLSVTAGIRTWVSIWRSMAVSRPLVRI